MVLQWHVLRNGTLPKAGKYEPCYPLQCCGVLQHVVVNPRLYALTSSIEQMMLWRVEMCASSKATRGRRFIENVAKATRVRRLIRMWPSRPH
jgi:hypothetical protein